ncbi:tail fiber protein [Hafnia alvei]|uniref:Phage tail fibre repeat-containing protein n=1 Tax=Hafnia alvei TaxID=569 RepID=A0A1C6Z3Q6_HAFAL|nr:tail fiber protein [Hafnia alvei]NLS55679.1 phage tail protein [Hafnia alvei]SCM53717.1 Phage tail fibre repeat-containing protein [Hafnia alvei]
MAQKYKAVLTKIGAAKIAAATAGGTKINLTQMAVGDGGGTLPTPDPAQTKLIAEKHRAALNKVIVDPKHKNYLVAELVIPPEIGGFWMRELGLYDEVGALIAVSNMAESYKPLLSEGSGRAQTLRMVVIVSDMDTVNLLIDSSTVLATQEYVDDKLLEHEQSRRHPDATLKEKGFTQLSSATNSESEALAATPKAVKAAYDLANGKYTAQDASTAKKGIVQLSSATNSPSETLAATPKAVKTAYDLASGKYTAQDASTIQKGIVQLNSATNSESETQAATPKAIKKANDNANGRLGKSSNLDDLADKNTARKNISAIGFSNERFRDGADFNDAPQNSTSFVYPSAKNSPGFSGSVLDFSGLGGGYNVEVSATYLTGGNRISFRTRNGDAGTWNQWFEIYHTGKKPTALDVGALPIVGGILNGNLTVKNQIQVGSVGNGFLTIGDSDSGLRSSVDGQVDLYANGRMFGYWNTTILSFTGQIIPTNYANFDTRYYTKAQSDAGYAPMLRSYSKAESDARYVRDIRMGANQSGIIWGGEGGTLPAGYVLTGGNFDDDREYPVYAPVQKYINGQWYNVGRA